MGMRCIFHLKVLFSETPGNTRLFKAEWWCTKVTCLQRWPPQHTLASLNTQRWLIKCHNQNLDTHMSVDPFVLQ